MKEHILDELKIMEERYGEQVAFDAHIFDLSLKNLKTREAVSIQQSATIADALKAMQAHYIGAIIVVNENNQVVGIVSERDIVMKALGQIDNYETQPVTEIMTPNPVCLHLEDSIRYLMNKMHVGHYRHVPIVDDQGHPVAVSTVRHVVEYILDQFPASEVMHLPIEPYRGVVGRDGG